MNAEKAFEIQKQARENVKTLNNYITDLQNWEAEMKRKEAALNGEFEQDLPPVRSKIKKEKPVQVKKKPENRIPSSDYKAWDKFDVDKACEEVDMEDVGPTSLDSKKSKEAKMEKLREEAQFEKERGNNFVKQEKWDEAIKCYNRAIELVNDDAIYYANRGLCYLKKDSLHQAEKDCTEALRLDPSYVKALQRRAAARERLGALRGAANDLANVLQLEPRNGQASAKLKDIKARMGTKGSKSKSSPSTTPTVESNPITSKTQPKIVEVEEPVKHTNPLDKWKNGDGENITVMKPVKKPPHLRSKRPLKSIEIQEIQLGKSAPDKPSTRLKIVEIDNLSHGDTIPEKNIIENDIAIKKDGQGDNKDIVNTKAVVNGQKGSPESVKLITDAMITEKSNRVAHLVPPMNSVQFMFEWKDLKGDDAARSEYLRIIEPSRIPSIFENALESDVLSELLCALQVNTANFKSVASYLQAFARVKRFSALAMFLTDKDKQLLTKLLDHCRNVEKCSENDIADLKNKYEL